MAYGTAIRQGFRILGKIDKKYNLNKIFIDKYAPPGYRKGLYKVVDIAGALGGGYGIYNFITSLYAPESPGMSAPVPFQKQLPKTYKQNKTRGRRTVYNRSRCPPRPYNRFRKRYS